jgi:formylglycine-generating enzyme required for sulfatase activity
MIKIAELAEYKPLFLTQCFEELRTAMGPVNYETTMKHILKPKNPGIPDALQRVVVIPFDGIITTNIDKLIEMAVKEAWKNGKRPTDINKYTSFSGNVQGELPRKRDWVWKIHGTIEQSETWIFTNSEYSKSIYGNSIYREALKTVVQGSRLVFIGFGGSDPDINQILKFLGNQFGGREDPHILFTRDKKELDIRSLSDLNIHIIEYGGPEDHSALTILLDKFPHFSYSKQEYVDFDDTAYREWLIGETDYIDIRGIGITEGGSTGAVHFQILDLYTKLYVREKPSNLELERGLIRGEKRVDLIEKANKTQCLAIVGDPGSGKTTFLRYIARNLLSDPNGPLPIYLKLGDVYEYFIGKQKSATTKEPQFEPQIFLEFLVYLSSKYNLNLSLVGLEKKIEKGHCYFLLDALDELPSTIVRENMVQNMYTASRLWKKSGCRFIITSRPLAMIGKSIPIGFELVGIDQLQDNDIRLFLETWTRLLFSNTSKDTRRCYCDSLLGAIGERPEIHQLARNPVMLTAMAVIHYNEKRLPEGRANLLEAVIQWLLHAKDRSPNTGRMPPKFTETMYREIALAMFDVGGVRKDRVGRGWIAEKISKHFNNDEEKALEFIKQEETETGILVRRGEGDLAFWLFPFQEYLAAKEIAGKTDYEGWSILQKNIDKTEWHEVVCLVPACLARLGTYRVDSFLERICQNYLDKNLSGKARGVSLGGCILKDLQVYGYEPISVPLWGKILQSIKPIFESDVQKISLDVRYDAMIGYGQGGDDRLRDFEKTWVSLPGGTFYMGTQSKDRFGLNYDPDNVEWEQPIVEVDILPFEIRKYLITVKEFDMFVSDGGYAAAREFWTPDGWEWRLKNNINAPKDWYRQLSFQNCPVSGISWFEAVAYCRWLTSNDLRNMVYRLPSEAEWEYAARRGLPSNQRFPWGNNLSKGELSEANWDGCNLRKKTPVGMFHKSNTWDGISDMIGNVEEWCADSWSETHLDSPKNGLPRVTPTERGCVVRGGSTIRVSRLCRLTYRSRCIKDNRYETIGFRPVRSLIRRKQ